MPPLSSELCWAHDRSELQRAAETDLENIRQVALKSALSWEAAAKLAERFEQRVAASQANTKKPIEQVRDGHLYPERASFLVALRALAETGS